MKSYDDKHIKNVAFVGSHHSGKTTLAETMLYEAGLLNRRGKIEEKNTVSDFHEIEKERQSSVFATPLHTEWRNYKINIIDTPGLDDFVGEVISAMRVSDTALMVINGQHGVEVGTEIIWDYIQRFHRPTVFVVNQIDHADMDFEKTYQSIASLQVIDGFVRSKRFLGRSHIGHARGKKRGRSIGKNPGKNRNRYRSYRRRA
jgi:elongation factor G